MVVSEGLPVSFARSVASSLLVVLMWTSLGCSEPKAGSDQPTGADGAPPIPVVSDESGSLLFSFLDERGQLRTAGKVAEVPASVRERVLVVDLARSPEERMAHRYAFFVDLTAKGPDGTYPVTTVSRYDAARGENGPTGLAPVPAGAVVIYSAEWCGFCKKAKRWMREHDVAYVERDVEKTPGAEAELSQKLAAAGLQGGGVPVIDWRGELIIGFDQPRLEGLLGKASE